MRRCEGIFLSFSGHPLIILLVDIVICHTRKSIKVALVMELPNQRGVEEEAAAVLVSSALFSAVERDDVNEIRRLCEVASVQPGNGFVVANEGGRTLLHKAVCENRTEVAKVLLDSGANPNVPNNNGVTPLHDAIWRGNLEIVRRMFEPGKASNDHGHQILADANLRDLNGTTALHDACVNGQHGVVPILLNNGADWRAETNCGNAPIHVAAINGHVDIVQLLAAQGDGDNNHEGANIQNWEGKTALHIASRNGDTNMVRMLLESGADPRRVDNQSKTPLDLACENNNTGAVYLLTQYQVGTFGSLFWPQ